ncbi:hypothetical protein [Natrinema sp. SYSU A 869]|uniref:hypothetical protein n=1 Tax=Natrinema sp. SYSU A 869 TaxID=2871694 RepID=UPI0031F32A12
MGLPTTDVPERPILTDLQSEVIGEQTDELAEIGQTVKDELSEPLDATLIGAELSDLADEMERVPDLREIGVPEYGEAPYMELTPAAWRIEEHLSKAGFFASAEDNLPAFTPEHIKQTTRQLLRMESLAETLSKLGFSDGEQLALVTNIVNTSDQLSWWETTNDYPPVESEDGYEEGVVHEYVSPLHKRAMEGALLWIDGLDWWIWQNEVLITGEMIDRAVWDVKSMLAGVYLLGDAAERVAEETISDENLTTLITASTAIMIIGQEFLVDDIVWIADDRKPRAEEV